MVRLLRRDKLDSNQALLTLKLLPEDGVVPGKLSPGHVDQHHFPSSLDGITGDENIVMHVNKFYIDKITKLRSGISSDSKFSTSASSAAAAEQEGIEVLNLCVPQEEMVTCYENVPAPISRYGYINQFGTSYMDICPT